jgi:glycosyltransferase involved in cell wall biosynthesis
MSAGGLDSTDFASQRKICAIVLTHNEERHLERCLSSLAGLVARLVVVDSGSTDATIAIARRLGADVYDHPWVNYATQFNWALDNAVITEDWCLRIDADEYLSAELRKSVLEEVRGGTIADAVFGLEVNRIMVFMNRPIRWGGVGDLYMLRLFRFGYGRCEERWMDEHIALDRGTVRRLKGTLVDHNLNNLGWWIAKHNAYATREAIDLLNIRYNFQPAQALEAQVERSQAARKRWLKVHIYSRLPGSIRAGLYFLWRFIFRLGFLDGSTGIAFHVLQGFWYRMLVDLKMTELERESRATGRPISSVIQSQYGYKVGPPAQ